MAPTETALALLRYGRELEREGAAQVGASFTGEPEADALLRRDSNAFVIGMLFTQGVPAERAWAGPFRLLQRLGTLDPAYLAREPQAVRHALQQPPMLHRFKETLPAWIVSAAERIVTEYAGDASLIWAPGSSVVEVTERLLAFDGIGRKKAVMGVEILMRHFGVELSGRECGSVAYDVHVRRVFLRAGLVSEDSPEAITEAASAICRESPGTLDLAAWLIGRQTCRPRQPRCEECRLGSACPRFTYLDAPGVGDARRR